jgi:hypothetical protein
MVADLWSLALGRRGRLGDFGISVALWNSAARDVQALFGETRVGLCCGMTAVLYNLMFNHRSNLAIFRPA